MGAYLFTTMCFRPWAGKLLQRHGATSILRLILILNAIALMIYTVTDLKGYFVARALQGVATAFFSMALQISIIDALPEKARSQGISLYSLCSYIPGIIGPLIAISIWNQDMNSFFVIMLFLAITTGVLGFTLKNDTTKKNQNLKNVEEQSVLRSIRLMWKNPDFMKSSIIMLGSSMLFGAVTVFIPLYALEIPHANAGIYLMVVAGTVVFMRFTLQKKIPSDGQWHSNIIMFALLLLAFGMQAVSYSLEGGLVFFYASAVMIGTVQAMIYPMLTTYLSFVLPYANRNILLGLFIATADLGVSISGILFGPIADQLSYAMMYQVCAVLAIFIIGITFCIQKWVGSEDSV